MKRSTVLSAAAVALLFQTAGPALAQQHVRDSGDNEFGIILGEPTGLSFKHWTNWNTALDFGLAWSFEGDGYLHIHADYLFHDFDAIHVNSGSLPYYFGLGVRAGFDEDDTRIGIRFVLGLEYYHSEYPVGFFGEIAPILDLVPETEMDVNGGIGVRFIF